MVELLEMVFYWFLGGLFVFSTVFWCLFGFSYGFSTVFLEIQICCSFLWFFEGFLAMGFGFLGVYLVFSMVFRRFFYWTLGGVARCKGGEPGPPAHRLSRAGHPHGGGR